MTAVLRGVRHWLAHLVGWNGGRVEAWWCPAGKLMVGFRCSGCGRLSMVHPAPRHRIYDDAGTGGAA